MSEERKYEWRIVERFGKRYRVRLCPNTPAFNRLIEKHRCAIYEVGHLPGGDTWFKHDDWMRDAVEVSA